MRIVIISHTYVVRANRGKLESLARLPGVEILLITPRMWENRDIGQRLNAERSRAGGIDVETLPTWSWGFGSLILYEPLALWRLLRRFRPDLVHLEEEPWSFAALELLLICRMQRLPLTFFSWENIDKRLPIPFRYIRQMVFKGAQAAVVGNVEAKTILQRHGFRRSVTVLPQLGVDSTEFQPSPAKVGPGTVVGYVGRLVVQKGLLVLLEAVATLPPDVGLMLIGNGPFRNTIQEKARELGLEQRLELHEGISHADVPQYLKRMSILVLPSLTTARWKEQFGHVLVEAMACGVPVIGSDSGAIPEVVGDAGLIVPEGSVEALAAALNRLISTPVLYADLAVRARARVLSEYTNDSIAGRLANFWKSVKEDGGTRDHESTTARHR